MAEPTFDPDAFIQEFDPDAFLAQFAEPANDPNIAAAMEQGGQSFEGDPEGYEQLAPWDPTRVEAEAPLGAQLREQQDWRRENPPVGFGEAVALGAADFFGAGPHVVRASAPSGRDARFDRMAGVDNRAEDARQRERAGRLGDALRRRTDLAYEERPKATIAGGLLPAVLTGGMAALRSGAKAAPLAGRLVTRAPGAGDTFMAALKSSFTRPTLAAGARTLGRGAAAGGAYGGAYGALSSDSLEELPGRVAEGAAGGALAGGVLAGGLAAAGRYVGRPLGTRFYERANRKAVQATGGPNEAAALEARGGFQGADRAAGRAALNEGVNLVNNPAGVARSTNAALQRVGQEVSALSAEATARGASFPLGEVMRRFQASLGPVVGKDPNTQAAVARLGRYMAKQAQNRGTWNPATRQMLQVDAGELHAIRQNLDDAVFGLTGRADPQGTLARSLGASFRQTVSEVLGEGMQRVGLGEAWQPVNRAYSQLSDFAGMAAEGGKAQVRQDVSPRSNLAVRAVGATLKPIFRMNVNELPTSRYGRSARRDDRLAGALLGREGARTPFAGAPYPAATMPPSSRVPPPAAPNPQAASASVSGAQQVTNAGKAKLPEGFGVMTRGQSPESVRALALRAEQEALASRGFKPAQNTGSVDRRKPRTAKQEEAFLRRMTDKDLKEVRERRAAPRTPAVEKQFPDVGEYLSPEELREAALRGAAPKKRATTKKKKE